jgi:hypothetical protein
MIPDLFVNSLDVCRIVPLILLLFYDDENDENDENKNYKKVERV